MNFDLSEKQSALKENAARLLGDGFSTETMRELEQSEAGFARHIWDEAIKHGWTGMTIAEEFGGAGVSLLDACVLLEEIGRAGANLPLVTSSGLAAAILQRAPQGAQRDLCLTHIAAGKIMSPVLIDAQSRNEWDSVRLPVTLEGDSYVLSGTKIMAHFAAAADALLVTAVTPDGDMVLLAVDPAMQGVDITPHHSGAGVPVASVAFDGARIAQENLIAKGEAAQAALHEGLHIGSLLATAEAIGLSETVKNITTEYVSKREAFGQPIGAFQAVAHPCADMHINAETIRLLTYQAAWMADNDKDAVEEISSTKALANELFERTANDAFCVHGAEGFAEACDLQLFMRRIRSFCQTMGETHESLERAAQSIGL